MLKPKFQIEPPVHHEAHIYLLSFLYYFQFLMFLPNFSSFINEMFLKNSKPLWQHNLSNTIFMFLKIVYIKREQEALFRSSLVGTKLQSIQGRSEGTSNVAFEVLIINCQIDFINLFIFNCLRSNINFFTPNCLMSNFRSP